MDDTTDCGVSSVYDGVDNPLSRVAVMRKDTLHALKSGVLISVYYKV